MLAIERWLMTKQRRSFTPEFKREAAALVLDQGYSCIEAWAARVRPAPMAKPAPTGAKRHDPDQQSPGT